jgi:hypothetical protein
MSVIQDRVMHGKEKQMAHPWYHAVLAARRYGGTPEDYLAVEPIFRMGA